MRNEYLISGAAGFIGSVLTRKLIKQGHRVIVISRHRFEDLPKVKQKLMAYANFIVCDLDNTERLKRELGVIFKSDHNATQSYGSRICINLAWSGTQGLSDLNTTAQLKNISRTINLLELCKIYSFERFLHIGTMEEYFALDYLQLDHLDTTKFNRHIIHAMCKYHAKTALRAYHKIYNLDVLFATNCHVIGPPDLRDSMLLTLIRDIIDGKRELVFSKGVQLFDVLSVFDLVDYYVDIANNGVKLVDYFLGTGSPQPLKCYIEAVTRTLGYRGSVRFGALGYDDVILPKAQFDITKLRSITNRVPRQSFEDSVRDVYKWLKFGELDDNVIIA
jgi:nucleoside-diphosphate-sugar epimerase